MDRLQATILAWPFYAVRGCQFLSKPQFCFVFGQDRPGNGPCPLPTVQKDR